MTQPKSQRGVSEKRPYSYAAPKPKQGELKCLPNDRIAALFHAVGWVRQRNTT